jgi:undecaprenyl-diphosphatase
MTTQAPARRFTITGLAGFVAVGAAGVAFALLLLLVRDQWQPLESVDDQVAASLNAFVSRHNMLQAALRAVTTLGSTLVLSLLVGVIALGLLVRHRSRLAAYLVITGAGALVMGPVLKLFVGRLRPVVEHTIVLAPGNSFPSGHALGSIVCYGAISLVFLPAVRGRARTAMLTAAAVIVVLIGFSRIALGVHFLSDVIGGWLLGAIWLAVTARAFETWRTQVGRRPTEPLKEGLEPEAAGDVRPAPRTDPAPSSVWWRVSAGLGVAWVFTFGLVWWIGRIVKNYKGNALGDRTIPEWFAAHRTPTLNGLSQAASMVGATPTVIGVAVIIIVLILAVTRLWRPAVFLATALIGEVLMFLAVVSLIDRERPPVVRLDPHLPTSSYPSGHLAATLCLYGSTAIVVLTATRRPWRWLVLALAIIAPLVVSWGRLYRGMHHPTDLLGSLVLAACWLTASYLLMRPSAPLPHSSESPEAAVGAGLGSQA